MAYAYTANDHRRAFDLWFECGSYQRTAAQMSEVPAFRLTVRNWSRHDFECPFGCPYHGWEALAIKRRESAKASVAPPAAPTPMVPVKGSRDEPQALKKDSMTRMARSDLDRLTHWEFIWSLLMFHVSGGYISACPHMVSEDGSVLGDAELRKLFMVAGNKPKSIESAVRTMAVVQGQIEKIVSATGLRKSKKHPAQISAEAIPSGEKCQLDLDTLRSFKEMYMQTPPEKRAALAQMFQSEMKVTSAQSSRPDAAISEPVAAREVP